MTITANASFNNTIALEGIQPVMLVEIDSNTDWYFSTNQLTAGQGAGFDDYDPIISSTPLITEELPTERFGVAIIGDVEFSILNTNPIKSDDIATDLSYMENKEVIIKYGFLKDENGDDFLLDSFITLYTGFVMDYVWNEEELRIIIIDASIKRHKTIPQTRNNDTNSPEKNIGKVIPITYGDWTNAYMKGIVTDTTLGSQKVRFDTQELHTMTRLFQYDKEFNSFIGLSETETDGTGLPEYVYTNASAWAIFNAAINEYSEKGLLLFRDFMLLDSVISSLDVDNPQNVIDGDLTTFARFNILNPTENIIDFIPKADEIGIGFSYGYADARYRIAQTTSLGEILNIIVALDITFPGGWVPDSQKYFWVQLNPTENFDEDGVNNAFVGGGYNGGNVWDNYAPEVVLFYNDQTTYTIPSGFPTMIFMIENGINGAFDGSNFKTRWKRQGWGNIKNGRLVFGGYYFKNVNNDFVVDIYGARLLVIWVTKFEETFEIHTTGKGRMFEAGWTGKVAADFVEKPADVINAIYRHELGLTDADIDETAFDDVTTYLDALLLRKFAGQIDEEKNSREVIDSLCKQSWTRQFKRNDGTETLKAYNVNDASVKDFDFDMVSNFEFGRSDFDLVYNEFYVNYNKNMASGEFESQKFVTANDDNFLLGGAIYQADCLVSQNNYNFVNTLTLDADFIRDDETAESLCKRLSDYYTDRRCRTTFDTLIEHGLLLELGDVITIDYGHLPDNVNGIAHKWEIVGFNKELTQVNLTAEHMVV